MSLLHPRACGPTLAIRRGTVAPSSRVCLAAAVELYHLQLFDALSLERPANLVQERERNKTLSKLFRGELEEHDLRMFRYVPLRTGKSPTEQGTTAPPG
jgi:hypothetical protein